MACKLSSQQKSLLASWHGEIGFALAEGFDPSYSQIANTMPYPVAHTIYISADITSAVAGSKPLIFYIYVLGFEVKTV